MLEQVPAELDDKSLDQLNAEHVDSLSDSAYLLEPPRSWHPQQASRRRRQLRWRSCTGARYASCVGDGGEPSGFASGCRCVGNLLNQNLN